ncbi:PspA-associated protein PspAB [Streptomyces sp. TR06-5]|uniref:PspA-associated protein PspAB n=1 Tax=unclassified Streptomyces TaxID=2593676 RepID=UPI0039A367E0
MGFLDALLGRSKPVRPDLDRLFALPAAAVTLRAGADLLPTGVGSVCFASVEGGGFTRLRREVRDLLDSDRAHGEDPVRFSRDQYGYTWLLARHPPEDLPSLVNDLHAVNTLLSETGFGPQLLCSLVGFRPVEDHTGSGAHPLALVYLYKRGTFYPFAPLPGEKRATALELRVRGLLEDDLSIEPDLSRWFPVWGAPGI